MSNDYSGVLVFGIDVSDRDPPPGIVDALKDDNAPAELVGYGEDGSGTILAVRDTLQSGEMRYSTEVDLDVPQEAIDAFLAFCKKFKVSNPEPKWLLAASYG